MVFFIKMQKIKRICYNNINKNKGSGGRNGKY